MTSFTNIFSHMAEKKEEIVIPKTDTPLGCHQGSIVDLPDIDIALAQTDGSIIKIGGNSFTVTAVGRTNFFGLNVYNCYLGDQNLFLRIVGSKSKVDEVRLFAKHAQVYPQSQGEWEFWLGMYQKDSLGNFVRDSMGNAVVQEFGLIGYPQFQIDGNPPTVYSRNWSSSNQGVLPMSYREEILDNQGNTYHVSHDAMEYVRDLSSESKEYLLATAVQQNNDACINIWIGLQFDPNSIKVLSV